MSSQTNKWRAPNATALARRDPLTKPLGSWITQDDETSRVTRKDTQRSASNIVPLLQHTNHASPPQASRRPIDIESARARANREHNDYRARKQLIESWRSEARITVEQMRKARAEIISSKRSQPAQHIAPRTTQNIIPLWFTLSALALFIATLACTLLLLPPRISTPANTEQCIAAEHPH